MKNKYKEYSNEELILQYARHFYDETKTAMNDEQRILKELASRNIISLQEMEKLYKTYSLS